MNADRILWMLGAFYLISTAWIDIASVLSARFTHLTFAEFGRRTLAKRLINDGVLLAACAWTLFLIGAIPAVINPLSAGERVMCYMLGVVLKDIAQPMQAVGWYRFWRAMATVTDE